MAGITMYAKRSRGIACFSILRLSSTKKALNKTDYLSTKCETVMLRFNGF